MAQVKINKDVRKNCVDTDKVIIECLTSSKREDIQEIVDSNHSSELNKKFLKFNIKNYAKYHQELVPIERVKYKLTYRNYAVY